jgi:hypothetical protein
MRTLKNLMLVVAITAVTILQAVQAAQAAPAGQASAAAGSASAAGGPPPGCRVVPTPNGWEVICGNGGGGPGGGGGGGSGGGGTDSCKLFPLPPGYPFPYPAPKGEKWMWIVCQMTEQTGLVLVPTGATTGNPGVTPQQLLQWALAELTVPVPRPATAPPRGHAGLVGLPEWVWLPAGQWRPVTAQVAVGPVWAKVTAVPGKITISPGGGLPDQSCAGPGTAYDPKLPARAQHTDCSYTFKQSSALQPGHAYQVSVSVTWTATWTGSDGSGGAVNPPLQETTTFPVRVAEGQALVSGGGR